MISRRKLLKRALATTASTLFVPMINKGKYKLFANSVEQYSERTVRLVKESLVIDMLNQFKSYFKEPTEKLNSWMSKPGSFTEMDFQEYLDSGIDVFSLGHGGFNYDEANEFFARWNGFIAGYDRRLVRVDSSSRFDSVKNASRIGILLSTQTASHFRSPDDVDHFYGLGQRVCQLTHNASNLIGSSFIETKDRGVTDFGASIVERMNQIGMAIDVSHCGDQTTLDGVDISKSPVLITHAGCRALVPNSWRCKTDEVIKKMAAKGGVIGIPYIRFMIRGEEPVTIEHVLDQYDYVVKLVGVEHVGIGGDFALDTDDQYPEDTKNLVAEVKSLDKNNRYAMHLSEAGLIGIEKLNHSKRVFDLTEGLIRRKYSDEHIRLILGGNFRRALSKIWSPVG